MIAIILLVITIVASMEQSPGRHFNNTKAAIMSRNIRSKLMDTSKFCGNTYDVKLTFILDYTGANFNSTFYSVEQIAGFVEHVFSQQHGRIESTILVSYQSDGRTRAYPDLDSFLLNGPETCNRDFHTSFYIAYHDFQSQLAEGQRRVIVLIHTEEMANRSIQLPEDIVYTLARKALLIVITMENRNGQSAISEEIKRVMYADKLAPLFPWRRQLPHFFHSESKHLLIINHLTRLACTMNSYNEYCERDIDCMNNMYCENNICSCKTILVHGSGGYYCAKGLDDSCMTSDLCLSGLRCKKGVCKLRRNKRICNRACKNDETCPKDMRCSSRGVCLYDHESGSRFHRTGTNTHKKSSIFYHGRHLQQTVPQLLAPSSSSGNQFVALIDGRPVEWKWEEPCSSDRLALTSMQQQVELKKVKKSHVRNIELRSTTAAIASIPLVTIIFLLVSNAVTIVRMMIYCFGTTADDGDHSDDDFENRTHDR